MRFHFFFFPLQVQRELNGSLIQKQPPSPPLRPDSMYEGPLIM